MVLTFRHGHRTASLTFKACGSPAALIWIWSDRVAAIRRLRVRILMNTRLLKPAEVLRLAAEVLRRDAVVAGVEALAGRGER